MPKTARAKLKGSTPVFRVQSLEASLEFYINVLGFKVDWQERRVFASVSRDGCTIYLAQLDQGNGGAWAWIGVDDADRLLEELQAKGAKVRHPPTNYTWAYEMQIEDPDGNVLRIGSAPKKDQPLGEWFDMRGHTWVKAPAGGWIRKP
jgi:predicted enzyme related to lactoylglutathione lyase